MTVIAWEHLVRDVLPRIEAEQQFSAALAAAVPHMSEEGRRNTLETWQRVAMTVIRSVSKQTETQAARFRRFLRRSGFNPDSGQENPRWSG